MPCADVDPSALVYEEWCSRDMQGVLSRHPRSSALDAGDVAPLLRLYVEQLPQPLIPPATVSALMAISGQFPRPTCS